MTTSRGLKPAAKPATTTATPNRISIPYPRVSQRQGKDLTLETVKPIGLAVADHMAGGGRGEMGADNEDGLVGSILEHSDGA